MKYDLSQQWIEGKFNHLCHHLRIPVSKFVYDIEFLPPHADRFVPYWREERRRIFQGRWVEHQIEDTGEIICKWIPGWTHFYVNHWFIEGDKKTRYGKAKVWFRPNLRDLEWIRGYIYAVAKGFSGFEDDPDRSCYRPLADLNQLSEALPLLSEEQIETLQTPAGTWKTYVPALELLYQEQKRPLGKALYMNTAESVMDVEARGSGKSFDAVGRTAWGWITDGLTDYDEYWSLVAQGTEAKTQQLFGAYDTSYLKTTLSHFFNGLNRLPGGGTADGVEYQSPLRKRWKGGILTDVGSIEQKVVDLRTRVESGSGTALHVRSFFGDPTAGNGPRCSQMFIEEAAFMENLRAAIGQMRGTVSIDNEQYGVIWMSGTGGETRGLATEETRAVMEDPKTYNVLALPDVCDNIHREIGMFVPGHMMLNQFKDEFGNTDWRAATEYMEREYEKATASNDPKALLQLKTRMPRKLSDALLSDAGSDFPIAELSEHLGQLLASTKAEDKGVWGKMMPVPGKKKEFRFVPDPQAVPLFTYPIKKDDPLHGCVVIYEEYDPRVPDNYYEAGTDPYNQDEVSASQSVGATYLVRRAVPGLGGVYDYDAVVASWVGRPATYTDYYEATRMLLIAYKAKCLCENETTLMRDHFANSNSLELLVGAPTLLRANIGSKVQRSFGQNMTPQVKRDLLAVTNKWLMEPISDGRKQLHTIKDIGLLREMIAHQPGGNFDRVIAFMLAIALLMQDRANMEMQRENSQTKQILEVLQARGASSRRLRKRLINQLPPMLGQFR